MAQTLADLDRRVTALERTQSDATETLRWHQARPQAGRAGRAHAAAGAGGLERVEEKVDALPRAIAELIDASEKRLMAAIGGR